MLDPKTIANKLIWVVLAGGTWWVAENITPKDIIEPQANQDQVDYYSKNITRIVLTEEGIPKEKLFAPLMTHYKNDDRTELDKPIETLYKKQGEPCLLYTSPSPRDS